METSLSYRTILYCVGAEDGDDLEMYGSETTASSQQTSYSFEVFESIYGLLILYPKILYHTFNKNILPKKF